MTTTVGISLGTTFVAPAIGACAIGACAIAMSAGLAQDPTELHEPVRLQADGAFIDTGEHVAHAGPLFADYDRNGVPDLLVGNFRGHIQVYKNVGTRHEPKLESKGLPGRGGLRPRRQGHRDVPGQTPPLRPVHGDILRFRGRRDATSCPRRQRQRQ